MILSARRKRASDFFAEQGIPNSTGCYLRRTRPDELPRMIRIGRAWFIESVEAETEWLDRKRAEAAGV